jgi:hypothetical protein
MEVSVIAQYHGGQPWMCRCYPTCYQIAEVVTQTHPAPTRGSRTARVVGIVDEPDADTAIELYAVPVNERWRLMAQRD